VLVLPAGTTGDVLVRIYTTALRRVAEERYPEVTAPVLRLPLRDRKGAPLSNGVYHVVLETSGGRMTTKWLVLR
jgi:hypothetical protein